MASDLSGAVRDVLGSVVRDALKSAGGNGSPLPTKKGGPFSGARGVAAGAGLAAAAPLVAKKGYDKLSGGGGLGASKVAGKAASKAGDSVGSKLKDTVSQKVDEAGGAGGLAKQAAGGLLGGGGGDGGGGKGGMPGVGKGRRMPVQQHADIAAPLETVYNQWTQFEDWPEFMHRVTNVTQDDDCTIKFATKIWGKTKEFEANIETQRPDERIKWSVSQGVTHAGVVTFHELAPNLTRVQVNLDVAPGSLIEKAARGMRHVKRAVRADLARFKAYIEMQELETGAWRGVIEDGELVEPHDDSYDEERDYSDVDDLKDLYGESSDEESEDDESEDDDEREESEGGNGHGGTRSERFKRQAARATSARSSSRSPGSSSSGSSKRTSSRSGSSGSSARKPAAKRSSGASKSPAKASKPAAKRTASKASSSKSSGGTNGKAASGSAGRSRSKSGTSNGRTTASRSKSASR